MDLQPFEYRDPGALIRDVADQVTLTGDTAFLVLVERPASVQRLVTVEKFDTPALIDDYMEAIQEIRERVETLRIPDHRPPTHSLMTVLVRPGLCVFGPNEGVWLNAWRYSNHLAPAFDSELILVTEHGWCDFATNDAGSWPALVSDEVLA